MRPAVLLPRKDDAVAGEPEQRVVGVGAAEDGAFPSSARHSSRPLPVAASAIRIDHGLPLRCGAKARISARAGMRMNTTCFESGDQTGPTSRSTLGSR